ncbi:serine protease 40-like [Callospermophilus lateralis]|uniref:serine protease 40-like n=1 Tax=Callospermophilus lateralis TaxID=76772 RepID=UPI004038D786
MASTGIKLSGVGRQGLCMATLLFCLCLQPLHAQNTMPNLSEVCGRTRFTGKIFGGQNAEPEQWPWQASVFLNGTYVCGAALIDSNWVASAAHCFQRSQNPDDYWILLGYNRMTDPSNYSMQMAVSQLIVHPDFDKHHFLGSDITLMKLHVPVNFNSHVLPACLPESSTKPDPKSSCWISGWGMTVDETDHAESLPPAITLQEAEVSLLDNEDCNAYYRYSDPNATGSKSVGVFDDMVCAGDPMNGTSICREAPPVSPALFTPPLDTRTQPLLNGQPPVRALHLNLDEEGIRHGKSCVLTISHQTLPPFFHSCILTSSRALLLGDSGGPLVCPLDGVWYLFGLTSWSAECRFPVGPSVFTNLSYFADWIKQHQKEAPTPSSIMASSTQKQPALSPVLKPRMTVLLSAQFLLLWLSLVSAQ